MVNLTKTTVNLTKHDVINLSKDNDGLSTVLIGLGWDPVKRGIFSGFFKQDIDCDAWLALYNEDNELLKDGIVYYGHTYYRDKSNNEVITHFGDNLTGAGAKGSDKEQILVKLSQLPKKCKHVIIGVTIYQGAQRSQSFKKINNTFIRVIDSKDNFEICRYNQKAMAGEGDYTTFIAGDLYKEDGKWMFRALGESSDASTIGAAAKMLENKLS